MALVVSVSNKLQAKYNASDDQKDSVVSDYLDSAGEDWRAFVDGVLKDSNENNDKTVKVSFNAGDITKTCTAPTTRK